MNREYKTTPEQRERQAEYRKAHLEETRSAVRRWREANREQDRAAARRWQEENPEHAKVMKRSYQYRQRYGIAPEQYLEMFDAQGGVCAICGNPPKDGRNLSVDHDHETKKVRALLCISCNTGVGYFERPIAEAIKKYLEVHR